MRRPATDDERRERTDRYIVQAIARAVESDPETVARLQRDRLENALAGFDFDENMPLAAGRPARKCSECGTWQAQK